MALQKLRVNKACLQASFDLSSSLVEVIRLTRFCRQLHVVSTFANKDYFLLGYSVHCKVTEAAE